MNEIQLAHLMDEIPSLDEKLKNIKKHMLARRFQQQILDENALRRKLTKMLETMDAHEKMTGEAA